MLFSLLDRPLLPRSAFVVFWTELHLKSWVGHPGSRKKILWPLECFKVTLIMKKKIEAAPSRIYTERTNLKPPSVAVKRQEPRNYHIQLAEVFWMYFHKLADNSLIFQNSRFSGPDGHSFLGWAALVGVCVFYLRNVFKGYSLNSNII